jgi:tripartite-type tricarboxylate transporter receptor subunit TctC
MAPGWRRGLAKAARLTKKGRAVGETKDTAVADDAARGQHAPAPLLFCFFYLNPSESFMHSRRLLTALACVLALSSGSAAMAQADNYPNHPIRMVVGFPPGGISDVIARTVAAKTASILKQSIVVENRPGAGTTIAADLVARSAPDGYTLLLQDTTTHAINASLYPKLPFDTIKSFTPVALVSSSPLMLVVNADSPAHTVKELIAMLAAKPGGYSYGSSGNGTIIHLASEMMDRAANVQAVHIPYKGSAPIIQALLSGDVAFAFSSMPPALTQVAAGKLRALAVSTPARIAAAPDVPTIAQAGVPAAEVILYNGVLGPAGMPADITAKLNKAFNEAVASDDVKKVYATLGVDPVSATTDQFLAQLKSDIVKYGTVVKEVGAHVD